MSRRASRPADRSTLDHGLPSRASLAALAPVALACNLLNPAFGDSQGPSTSAGPTGTQTGESSATATLTDPTSSTDSASSVGSTGSTDSDTTAPTSTAPTASTTDETGSSSGSSTGEPADCWGLAPDEGWEVMPIEDNNLGVSPKSVRLSPDGYTLYYIAGEPQKPHVSTRATLTDIFADGAPIPGWSAAPGFILDHITVDADESEMIYTGPQAGDFNLLVTTKSDDQWLPHSALGGVNTMAVDRSSSLNEDGSRILFERVGADINPVLGNVWRFFEAKRPSNAAPGTGFVEATPVVLPGVTDNADYAHPVLCGVLSPDGLRLLYGSSYPDELDANDLDDAQYVLTSKRQSLDSAWGPPTRLESLQTPSWQSCPESITRDGCQMTFFQFKYPFDPNEPDPLRAFIARRSP